MTNPPKRFPKSVASSREKLLSSPVKTNDKPASASGAPSGTSFDPWATGPASWAAFFAAQLSREKKWGLKQKFKKQNALEFFWSFLWLRRWLLLGNRLRLVHFGGARLLDRGFPLLWFNLLLFHKLIIVTIASRFHVEVVILIPFLSFNLAGRCSGLGRRRL